MELLYSEECPYCRTAAGVVRTLDIPGWVETVPIESMRGEAMVQQHHGEYVHTPHLFTEERVYYGVGTTAKGVVKEYAKTAWDAVTP